jgi:hypothetical protein
MSLDYARDSPERPAGKNHLDSPAWLKNSSPFFLLTSAYQNNWRNLQRRFARFPIPFC